jgi:hypothetical protein
VNQQPNLFNSQSRFDPAHWQQPIAPIPLQKDNAGDNLFNLIPPEGILALTLSFSAKSVHLGKILDYLYKEQDMKLTSREDISDFLGIPLARTRSTFYIMRRTGLVSSKNQITEFGKLICKINPYFDNAGMLWFYHYSLASNANLVIWSYLFNQAFHLKSEIPLNEITHDLSILSGKWSEISLRKKVPAEAAGILNSYIEGFLYPLNLVSKYETGVYICSTNPTSVPDLVWLAAILAYRDRYYPGAPSLEVPLIVDAHFAPGRLFRANEMETRTRLDTINDLGLISVETRSGLDQVRFKRDITWLSALALYLQGNAA